MKTTKQRLIGKYYVWWIRSNTYHYEYIGGVYSHGYNINYHSYSYTCGVVPICIIK